MARVDITHDHSLTASKFNPRRTGFTKAQRDAAIARGQEEVLEEEIWHEEAEDDENEAPAYYPPGVNGKDWI